MKKALILIIILMIGKLAISQVEIDKLMTDKVPNCNDIAYNCTNLIMKYYSSNKLDSVDIILKYWENKCGLTDNLINSKILFAIINKNFTEDIYDSTVIYLALRYKNKINSMLEINGNNYNYYNYGKSLINLIYDKFLMKTAFEFIPFQEENSLEYLFCKLYSGDFTYFFNELKSEEKYNGTKLKKCSNKIKNKNKNKSNFTEGLCTGVWIPFGKASLLGVHPFFGFNMGGIIKKTTIELAFQVRYLKSPNEYKVYYLDSIYKTSNFTGYYAGLEIDQELMRLDNMSINIIGGVAYDGFTAIKGNTKDKRTDNDNPKDIGSLNLNAGVVYKYYYENNSFLNVKLKYNYVNFKNDKGTDLSGNMITLSLGWSLFVNKYNNGYFGGYNYYQY